MGQRTRSWLALFELALSLSVCHCHFRGMPQEMWVSRFLNNRCNWIHSLLRLSLCSFPKHWIASWEQAWVCSYIFCRLTVIHSAVSVLLKLLVESSEIQVPQPSSPSLSLPSSIYGLDCCHVGCRLFILPDIPGMYCGPAFLNLSLVFK